MKYICILWLHVVLCISLGHAQHAANDTLPYTMFKDRLVLHSSIGINDAPFSLSGDFNSLDNLKYRANLNTIMGFGFAYKWLALNINFKLPGYIRNTADFGKTNYFDLGVKFGIKKWFFAVDFHGYSGFGIKDAHQLNDTLPVSNRNVFVNQNVQSFSLSFNGYRFKNEHFKIKPAIGIVGHYREKTSSFYVKYTINTHGVGASNGIMPSDFFNYSASVYAANSISAFDFGAVPGYAYINNHNGWQYGFLAGLGAVIQAKVFSFPANTRGFLGLAPRLDLKAQAGYNVDNWFLMFTSSFDNKSIRFNDFRYRQVYYYLRLTYGYRF